ncbi:hypothetical protein BDB01DRAFT_846011 [Pilobolus umbonatus]|nr:hypothetical protein BDB01DRAFT_846011 [Pilobolus umbonatus]
MADILHSVKGSSVFQSESPEPSVLQAVILKPEDYKQRIWKNGLGRTEEISVYPSDKIFEKDDFFWRLSVDTIQADCSFALTPGYERTLILLPDEFEENSSLDLSHQGKESTSKVQSLFPYSWDGAWSTVCKVTQPPARILQVLFKKDAGNVQIRVEKVGEFEGHTQVDVDSGKNIIFGAFFLIYAVEGHVKIILDENRCDEREYIIQSGQTLMIERDEDATPTNLSMSACRSEEDTSPHGIESTVVIIQLEEGKTYGGVLNKENENESSVLGYDNQGIVPSQRRPMARRPSLLVSIDDSKASMTEEALKEKNEQDESNKVNRRDSLTSLEFNGIYAPPDFPGFHKGADMPPPVTRDKLEVSEYPLQTISTAWIKIMTQGLGEWIKIPIIVCRGTEEGPCVGITAAVHGNELNGVPSIHRVVSQIDVNKLKGTIIAVPCVNVWGFLRFQREFADGRDLNRQFPGKEDGYASQVYCHHLMNKIISQFNYMIDLHTASFGRINSYYVRVDMNDPTAARMARLQQPQILLHNSGQDGTLRSAAAARGIKAITVEIGNPQMFQDRYVQWASMGIMRILDYLKVFSIEATVAIHTADSGPPHTVLCSKGFWLYTKTGGLLEVYPGINHLVKKGEVIACIKNMFGNVIEEYFAPCTGMVIGRSSNPVAMSGDRILHMGIIKKSGEVLAKAAKENY